MILAACCLSSVSLFTSCDDYDDTELWNKVNGLEERIAALEEWQKTTDNNLNALQTLINTMDYITSVAPIMQANDTIGYTINFHQSNPISIYNGTTSQIGITQDEEGNWLWTLDGEILTTPDGTPIPANGQDAAAPQLSTGKALQDEGIKTDAAGDAIIADIAYLSVDEGETWYRVTGEKGEQGDKGNTGSTGPAGPAGANGDSFFKDVEIVGNNVIFTLADGKTFTVAKYNGALTFMQNGKALDLTQTIDLADGTLTYAPSDAEVSARIIDGEGWSASAAKGTITVNAGSIDENAEATLEITLLENGRVIETYQLTVKQTGLQGEGTAAAPYTVSSATELAYIAEQVKKSSEGYYYYQKVIQLTQDIDLEGTELSIGIYDPSGENSKYFYGTLDGNGHSIKGLKIENKDQDYVGLFPYLAKYATVKNLTLEEPVIETKGSRVGALAGYSNNANIENCHVIDAEISGITNVGGLIGELNGGNITNCSATGIITATNDQVGGIIGSTGYNITAVITACRFNGTLKADYESGRAGGIVGVIGNSTATITACYASGSFSSGTTSSIVPSCSLGGIVGIGMNNANVTLKACYANVTLDNEEENQVPSKGGIIGSNSATLNVSDCYWASASTTAGVGGSGTVTGSATQVTNNDWSAALTAMNTALSGTGWQYAENTDPDTKASLPLILKEQ